MDARKADCMAIKIGGTAKAGLSSFHGRRAFFIGGKKMKANQQMADLLFPDVQVGVQEIIARYPQRDLPDGAMVTRLAPSPTGELHIGTMYAAFLSYRLAKQTGGAFYIRLDDTDQKREVPGARNRIPRELRRFGIEYEEGYFPDDIEIGGYGPYVQTRRRYIYRVFAKDLVAQGRAYPCFCDEQALEVMRAEQKRQGADIGYYGMWAVHRDMTLEQAKQEIAAGKPFVIRLRSPGEPGRRVSFHDMFKGEVIMPENVQDIVLIKSDGLPTYHFAHAVDDSLMHTTHVVRGDEWLSSYPVHRQLFEALGQNPPVYGHLAPIMKKEGTSKRKFSKRRDADGHAAYYRAQGIPPLALREYYMRLINSAYEDWRRAHPDLPLESYEIDLNNLGVSGPVFDMEKLRDIAKDVIAAMDAGEVLSDLLPWAQEFDPALYDALLRDQAYALAVLGIGRGIAKPRKDIGKWMMSGRCLDISGMCSFLWIQDCFSIGLGRPPFCGCTWRSMILRGQKKPGTSI
jgi:glutamyl-tRNA synthetase